MRLVRDRGFEEGFFIVFLSLIEATGNRSFPSFRYRFVYILPRYSLTAPQCSPVLPYCPLDDSSLHIFAASLLPHALSLLARAPLYGHFLQPRVSYKLLPPCKFAHGASDTARRRYSSERCW